MGSPRPVIDMPDTLQILIKWWGLAVIVFGIVAFATSYLFAAADPTVLASLVVGCALVLWFVGVLTRHYLQSNRRAQTILSAPQGTSGTALTAAIRDLKRSSGYIALVIAFLVAVAAGEGVALLYQPVSRWVRTARPVAVKFDSMDYFDPSRDAALLQGSPFLEAVITYLKDEAAAEGRKTGIVLGRAMPFGYPTPAFRLFIPVDNEDVVVTGYGFLEHTTGGRLFYAPVPVRYTKKGALVFNLPPCDPGDKFMFVGRLSLTNPGASLPARPKETIVLSQSEVE